MLTLNDGRKELYQWDMGRKATVSVSCDVVHFSNLNYGESLAVEVKGGEVEIPNILLMNGAPVYCWAFITDEGGAYTKAEQVLKVIKRAKPSDYVYVPTEIVSIKSVVKNALEEAKETGEFDGKSAYQYAVDGGYEGTEEDFYKDLSGVGNNGGAGDVTTEYANNTFSNALKGKKSGSAILISDTSPLEHNLGVKVTGVPDASSVKVRVPGKNLFNLDRPWDVKGTYEGWLVNPLGETVTLTIIDKDPSIDVGEIYIGLTANGTTTPIHAWSVVAGQLKIEKTTATKDNKYLSMYKLDSTTIETIKKRFDIQVEYGSNSTEYEPYQGEEYTVNEDGVVEGVKSKYPTMTLLVDTDGAVIDCEYNRDINKAFAELQSVIISLGGNV